jgi:hypothetical protein
LALPLPFPSSSSLSSSYSHLPMDTQWCLTCNRHLVRISLPYPSPPPSQTSPVDLTRHPGELRRSLLLFGVLS